MTIIVNYFALKCQSAGNCISANTQVGKWHGMAAEIADRRFLR
jgi:hypothetical protein